MYKTSSYKKDKIGRWPLTAKIRYITVTKITLYNKGQVYLYNKGQVYLLQVRCYITLCNICALTYCTTVEQRSFYHVGLSKEIKGNNWLLRFKVI